MHCMAINNIYLQNILIFQKLNRCASETLIPNLPLSPAPRDPHSTLCFYDSDYARYLTSVELYNSYLLVTGLFPSARCLQDASV